jgi:G3E family GTPase
MFASTLLLNKSDAVSVEQLQRVEKALRRVNGHAPIVHCSYCDVPVRLSLPPSLLIPSSFLLAPAIRPMI